MADEIAKPSDEVKLVLDPKAPLQDQMDAYFKKKSDADLAQRILDYVKDEDEKAASESGK